MSREKEELQGVTLLGNQKTKYPQDYAPEMLETFINKHQDHDYFVKFNCPGVYKSLSNDRTAGFCDDLYFLCSGCEDGREQVFKVVFIQF